MIDLNPAFYSKTPDGIWNGRNDGDHLAVQRWHQRIIPIDLRYQDIPLLSKSQQGIALIGFACDEGVRRNGGRTGAKEGSAHFRKASCNLPVQFEEDELFIDLGDIICENEAMEEAQQALALVVSQALKMGYRPMVIGGGHEVAYGHYSGINNYRRESGTAGVDESNLGIINFDAHFDLREPAESGTNSGTGFFQIAHECKLQNREFRYLPVGIQRNSNTVHLFNTAKELGVKYITAEQFQPLMQQELILQLEEFIAGSACIYLTICMDVFSSSVAPGVSAPAYSGLFPDPFFFDFLNRIMASGKVISMDIAELNPAYDNEQRTAKLAAALAFSMITG